MHAKASTMLAKRLKNLKRLKKLLTAPLMGYKTTKFTGKVLYKITYS